jgi:hypothetical protein
VIGCAELKGGNMVESKTTSQQKHTEFLIEMAQKIDRLVCTGANADYFRSKIRDFCKKVDAYERSQEVGRSGQSLPNPLHWFPPHTSLHQYDPNSHLEKQPNEEEKVMICCVLLGIVHDKALTDPQYERIWFGPSYIGDRSFRDTWGNGLWPYLSNLSVYNQAERETYATRIRNMVEHAFDRVNDELAQKPEETEQETKAAKGGGM